MACTRPTYFFLLIASLLNLTVLLAITILPSQNFRVRCQRYIRTARRNETGFNAAAPASDLITPVMAGFTPATVKVDRTLASPLAMLAGFLYSPVAICQSGYIRLYYNNYAPQLNLHRYRLSGDHPPEFVL